MNKYAVSDYDSIVIIGSGGTGGYIVPAVIRMVSHMTANRPSITIIDPDKVETKNCNRQNFVMGDVGKHKAQVHAERYSAAFGVPVNYITAKLDFTNMRQYVDTVEGRILIVESVDNVRARRQIWQYVRASNRHDWLSLGNTDKNGQAVLYSKSIFGHHARSVITAFPEDFSSEVARHEAETERRRSCGDNAVANPQSLAINMTAANIAVNILYQLLYDKEISHDVVFFDRYNYNRAVRAGSPLVENVDQSKADRLALLLGGTVSTSDVTAAPSNVQGIGITEENYTITYHN